MIKFQALSGPYVGEKRDIPQGINPMNLLTEFSSKDWKWSIDFSQATQQELFEWGRADMITRILAALQYGRSFWFQNTEYRAEKLVESDDSKGIIIGVGDTESPIQ